SDMLTLHHPASQSQLQVSNITVKAPGIRCAPPPIAADAGSRTRAVSPSAPVALSRRRMARLMATIPAWLQSRHPVLLHQVRPPALLHQARPPVWLRAPHQA